MSFPWGVCFYVFCMQNKGVHMRCECTCCGKLWYVSYVCYGMSVYYKPCVRLMCGVGGV